MDSFRMSGRVECGCGWTGEVPTPGEGKQVTCPGCGQPLQPSPAVQAPPEPVAESDAATVAPAATPQPAASTTSKPSGGKIAWEWTLRRLGLVGAYIRAAFAFYWQWHRDLRVGLRRWMLQFFPALEDPERVRRAIRVPLREGNRLTVRDEVWQFQLPGRCIICGSRGSGDARWLEREVLDPYLMLVVPVAGAFLSLFFGWWYQSLLLFLLLLPGGILAGYALRRLVHLKVGFERCSRHATSEREPDVEIWHNELLVWTGASEVRQAYLGRLADDTDSAEELDQAYVPPERSAPDPPETLALADDVPESSRIVHESPGRLAPEDEDGDLFGPASGSLPAGGTHLPVAPEDKEPAGG